MFDWVTFGHLRIHSEQAAVLDSCLSRVGPMQFTFAHQLAHNLVAPWDNNSAAQIPTFIPNSWRTLGNSIYKSQDLIETHIHRGLSKVTVKTLFPEYDLFNQPDDSNRLVERPIWDIWANCLRRTMCLSIEGQKIWCFGVKQQATKYVNTKCRQSAHIHSINGYNTHTVQSFAPLTWHPNFHLIYMWIFNF